MRDLDREIGLQRDTDARSVEARHLGDWLLYMDEIEEELEAARNGGRRADPARMQRLEREASAERDKLHAMESRGGIDYGEIGRAMQDPER